jgi:hypothetical protein
MKGIADPESFRKSRMQLYGVERGNGIPVILENVVLLRRFQKKIGACIDLRLVLACLCVHEAIQTRSHQHQTAQSSVGCWGGTCCIFICVRAKLTNLAVYDYRRVRISKLYSRSIAYFRYSTTISHTLESTDGITHMQAVPDHFPDFPRRPHVLPKNRCAVANMVLAMPRNAPDGVSKHDVFIPAHLRGDGEENLYSDATRSTHAGLRLGILDKRCVGSTTIRPPLRFLPPIF